MDGECKYLDAGPMKEFDEIVHLKMPPPGDKSKSAVPIAPATLFQGYQARFQADATGRQSITPVNLPAPSPAKAKEVKEMPKLPVRAKGDLYTRTQRQIQDPNLTKVDYDKPYQRRDLPLDKETRSANQRFANTLNPFGYLPNGVEDAQKIDDAVDSTKARWKQFQSDFSNPEYAKDKNVSPNSRLDLSKPSHLRRYDAVKNYLGLPQETFVPSSYQPDGGEAYPKFKFKNEELERRYKQQALEHGLFSKFKEAESQGKDAYAETTHDDNAVANAFTIGMKRDKTTSKPYVFYRDVWDLAVNPADNIADRVPRGIRSGTQRLISKLQKPVTGGVEGKPFVLYGRQYVSDQDSARYAKIPYRKLNADRNTHQDSE